MIGRCATSRSSASSTSAADSTGSAGQRPRSPTSYRARDLTTHAVCVGMTGSGKTGLGISPPRGGGDRRHPGLAIDPKGDLGNLALAFPQLRPEDFAPWIDPDEARRAGQIPGRAGGGDGRALARGPRGERPGRARVARSRGAAEVAIYTPGSRAGRPLSLLRSFAPPPAALAGDAEALRERVAGRGVGPARAARPRRRPGAEPRAHPPRAIVVEPRGSAARSSSSGLIRAIQQPPFARVGVLELESFFPAQDRFALAASSTTCSRRRRSKRGSRANRSTSAACSHGRTGGRASRSSRSRTSPTPSACSSSRCSSPRSWRGCARSRAPSRCARCSTWTRCSATSRRPRTRRRRCRS